MRIFRCLVEMETKKSEDVPTTKESQVWIVRADNQDLADRKIHRHFREYHLLKSGKTIVAIHFTEIHLDGAIDLEEYLESKEDATVCVLF